MKIDKKSVLIILLISTLLGLLYNYFSSTGIPLIAEQRELRWAVDSLLFKSEGNFTFRNDSSETAGSKNQRSAGDIQNFETEMRQSSENNSSEKNELVEEQAKIEEPELSEPHAINLEQAYRFYNQDILFIDARESIDYEIAHIKNAINIPADHFDDYKHILDHIDKEQTIVTYCSGSDCDLSIVLGNLMFDIGYKKVYVFFGGWNEWLEANYPIEEGIQTE